MCIFSALKRLKGLNEQHKLLQGGGVVGDKVNVVFSFDCLFLLCQNNCVGKQRTVCYLVHVELQSLPNELRQC